jgi:hypothetical protein
MSAAVDPTVMALWKSLLWSKADILLKCVDPNERLLMDFQSRLYNRGIQQLDDDTWKTVFSQRAIPYDKNAALLLWLERSCQESFEEFLGALRADLQGHVANAINNSDGERPLSMAAHGRLMRIAPVLGEILRVDRALLDRLRANGAVNYANNEQLKSTDIENRCYVLVDVLLKRSDWALCRTMDALCQHCLPLIGRYLHQGEVVPIRVQLTTIIDGLPVGSPVLQVDASTIAGELSRYLRGDCTDLYMEAKLDATLRLLRPTEFDGEQHNWPQLLATNKYADRYRRGGHEGGSDTGYGRPSVFMYCETLEAMDVLGQWVDSGHLAEVLRDVFQLLLHPAATAAAVRISSVEISVNSHDRQRSYIALRDAGNRSTVERPETDRLEIYDRHWDLEMHDPVN